MLIGILQPMTSGFIFIFILFGHLQVFCRKGPGLDRARGLQRDHVRRCRCAALARARTRAWTPGTRGSRVPCQTEGPQQIDGLPRLGRHGGLYG